MSVITADKNGDLQVSSGQKTAHEEKPSQEGNVKPGTRGSFKLTPEQERAASYGTGTRAVVATAGSGKTTTMSYRIAGLMEDHKVPDHEILATTFTNAGASDLKNRIDQMVGRKTSIQAGTLHSFCVNLLLRNSSLLGYTNQLTILDPGQRASFVDQLMLQVTGLKSKKDITHFSTEDVHRWLAELDVREFTSDERDFSPWTLGKRTPRAVLEICRLYKERCRLYGYLDFDSILTEALRLLRLGNEKVIRSLPKYVFVDEAQDLSAIQWFIVEELVKTSKSLDIIGDDDQSIYQWRAALPWRFRSFVERADHKYFLSANRRCAKGIVALASEIISEIPPTRRVEKDLSAVRDVAGMIRYSVLPRLDHLFLVAKKIKEEVRKGKLSYDDFAIIARATTRVFPALEGALKKLEVPYRILGGKSTFDKPEARLVRSIGNIVVAKEGSEPFAHWQTLFADVGVTPGASDKIMREAQSSGGSHNNLLWAVKGSKISLGNKNSLERLLGAVKDLRQEAKPKLRHLFENPVISEAISDLIARRADAEIGARRKKEGGMTAEDARKMADLLFSDRKEALLTAMEGYYDEHLLSAMMNMDVSKKEEKEDGEAKVTISTAHSSKGLEWDTVFVMEANSATWPSGQSGKGLKDAPVHVHQDVQDEERRLLYVAITRAKNNLYLMTTVTHPVSGDAQAPSFFLPNWLRSEVTPLFPSVLAKWLSEALTLIPPALR